MEKLRERQREDNEKVERMQESLRKQKEELTQKADKRVLVNAQQVSKLQHQIDTHHQPPSQPITVEQSDHAVNEITK